jgi:hypothetical protein
VVGRHLSRLGQALFERSLLHGLDRQGHPIGGDQASILIHATVLGCRHGVATRRFGGLVARLGSREFLTVIAQSIGRPTGKWSRRA